MLVEPYYRYKTGFFKTIYVMILNVVNSWDLIFQLTRRDLLMVYKKSFLGYSWIFIAPIMGILSWVIMKSTGVLTPGDVGIPYPAYVLISTSIWGLFMGFITASSNTLQAGEGFILQVNFPHEALFVKQILHHIANFTITFGVSMVFVLIFWFVPNWKIIFFPFLILPLLFLGSSIGLLISLIKIVAVDIQRAIEFAISLLMFITPVIYSNKIANPSLQIAMKYNPLTYLIGGIRDVIVSGHMNHPMIFLIVSLCTLIMFLISLRLFYVLEDKIVERIL